MTATKDVVGYQRKSARRTRLLTYELSNSGRESSAGSRPPNALEVHARRSTKISHAGLGTWLVSSVRFRDGHPKMTAGGQKRLKVRAEVTTRKLNALGGERVGSPYAEVPEGPD